MLYKLAHIIRDRISLSDDGVRDAYEELWEKFVVALEGNVLTMTLAHLFVQATRTYITGVIPMPNGTVPPGFLPNRAEAFMLVSCGCLYACGIPVVNMCKPSINGKELKVTNSRLKAMLGNCVAFCWLWSTNWYLGG